MPYGVFVRHVPDPGLKRLYLKTSVLSLGLRFRIIWGKDSSSGPRGLWTSGSGGIETDECKVKKSNKLGGNEVTIIHLPTTYSVAW